MNRDYLYKEFLKIERDCNLFSISAQGIPIWERMRKHIYSDLVQELCVSGRGPTGAQRNPRSYIKGFYLWAKNSMWQNPFLADNHDYLFYGSPRRKLQDDDQWWDIYCDPIHSETSFDYLQVEEDNYLNHFSPPKTENLRYLDFIHYTDFIKRRMGLISTTLDDKTENALNVAKREFKDRFDVELRIAERAKKQLRISTSREPLYDRFLATVDPSVVVVICSYGKETFIKACKKKEVPVVELQHGVIDNTHLGYSYPGFRTKLTFPDYLFVWGKFWKNAAEYPIPTERIIPVGYPYLEQQAEQFINSGLKEQIVFISQPTIGKSLSKFAIEVNRNPNIEHDIVYKLHPKEYDHWSRKYPWLVDTNIQVIDGTGPQLYQLFAESDVQIGVYSTAIYEGLCFELDTYLYDCTGIEALQPLLNDGAAKLVSSPEELESLLGQPLKNFNREDFFIPNATDNLRRELILIQQSYGTASGQITK